MFIKKELYIKILQHIPILCVDVIIKNKNKFLLLKRNNEPLKNFFYLPGGRVFKCENLHYSAIRKISEETGLKVLKKQLDIVGIYQDTFNRNAFDDHERYNTVSIVFLIELISIENIRYDSQSTDFKWAKKLPSRFLKKTIFLKHI